MIKIFCDRCGEELVCYNIKETSPTPLNISLNNGIYYALCSNCYNLAKQLIHDFINKEE